MTFVRRHTGHFIYMALHKWAVLVYGLFYGVPLRLLVIHDASKFTRAEWPAYTRWFFGPQQKNTPEHLAFLLAWAHHWQHNPHHHEYWCHHVTERRGLVQVRPIEPRAMPEVYVREMAADWQAASFAKRWCYNLGLNIVKDPGQSCREFYEQRREQLRLHPDTRQLFESLIGISAPL